MLESDAKFNTCFCVFLSTHSHSRGRKKKAKKSKKARRSSSLSSIDSPASEVETKKDKRSSNRKKKYSDISDNTSDFGSESGKALPNNLNLEHF